VGENETCPSIFLTPKPEEALLHESAKIAFEGEVTLNDAKSILEADREIIEEWKWMRSPNGYLHLQKSSDMSAASHESLRIGNRPLTGVRNR
jgi:hypothetical protein